MHIVDSLADISRFVALRRDTHARPELGFKEHRTSTIAADLPIVAEAGVPGYVFDSWIGLLAPAGTPKVEVNRINNAMTKVLAMPAVQERFVNQGVEIGGSMSPDAFQKLLRRLGRGRATGEGFEGEGGVKARLGLF